MIFANQNDSDLKDELFRISSSNVSDLEHVTNKAHQFAGVMDRLPKKEKSIEAKNEDKVDPFARFPDNVNPNTGKHTRFKYENRDLFIVYISNKN